MYKKNPMITSLLMVVMISIFLFGCGSSTDSEKLQTGIFVDNTVEGLKFESGSRVGFTDQEGQFYFKDSDTVTFSIGGLVIGSTSSPKEILTPFDIDGLDDSFVTHPKVINISRLLQTLDEDEDADNGILISEAIRNAVEEWAKNENVEEFEFDDDTNFENQMTSLLDHLNVGGGSRTLVSKEDAIAHFFKSLADHNATPVVMINLGDGFTNGTQSGFGNVHENTQVSSFAAYLSYHLTSACDLVSENPFLEITEENADSRNATRIVNSESDFGEGEEYIPYDLPTNLGIDGSSIQSVVETSTNINGGDYSLINELLLPIPQPDYNNGDVTQLEAALYVAEQHPGRLKLFTLWIGAEDTLGAITGDRSSNLTETEINDFLNDTDAGHDLNSIEANLDIILQDLSGIDYSYIFIATLPHVETIGAFYGKTDIETLASFEGALVTAIGENELIGYNPFIDKDGSIGASIADALDSDNETLNNAILQTIATDGNFLNQAEINLINARIDDINGMIADLPARTEDPLDPLYEANIIVVDVTANIFDKLIPLNETGGVLISNEDDDEVKLYKTFGIDKGFYSLDGYHPSLSGAIKISKEFISAINDEGIGIAVDPDLFDIVESVLPVDFYNIDADEDGFVLAPGFISLTIPIYDDDQVGGWIDCNDSNDTVFPEFVSGIDCF